MMPSKGYCKLCAWGRRTDLDMMLAGGLSPEQAADWCVTQGLRVGATAITRHMGHMGDRQEDGAIDASGKAAACVSRDDDGVITLDVARALVARDGDGLQGVGAAQLGDVVGADGMTRGDVVVRAALEVIIAAGISALRGGRLSLNAGSLVQALNLYASRYGGRADDRLATLLADMGLGVRVDVTVGVSRGDAGDAGKAGPAGEAE